MTFFPLVTTLALATVLAIIAVLVILRYGIRLGLVMVAAMVLAVGLGWAVIERLDSHGKLEQRRVIEARLNVLNAQALQPNSSLACLDAAGGDLVHEACERALFSGPEQVAAALNYVGARLDLLREIAALPDLQKESLEGLRAPIARSLEADRFGLVSQILMARDNCSPAACYAFDFLDRRDRLVANMKDNAYQARLTRFAATWNDKPTAPSAPALAAQTAAPPAPPSPPSTPTPPAQSSLNIDFPSADSIPAVSIMSNEPGRPGQNGVTPPRAEAKPSQQRPEARAAEPETRAPEPRPQTAPTPPRRPAQKAQARPAAPPPPPPAPAAADPFPQPVGSTPQTTGTQQN